MSMKKKKAVKKVPAGAAATSANTPSGARAGSGTTTGHRNAEAANGSLLSHLLEKTRLVFSPLRKAEA